MHPPSRQLLRSLRSALLPPAAYCRTSRHSISPAPIQLPCQNISRHLSYSPPSHRPDDGHARKPSQKPPPPHDRRSDLSTADLKPKTHERDPRASAEAGAERESKEGAGDEKDGSSSSSSDKQRADLRSLDVFADVSAPTTAIDSCVADGFHFNNGLKITGGDGCLLVDGEVFTWRPWEAAEGNSKGKAGTMSAMVNEKGQWEIGPEAFGVLSLVWPRPGETYFFLLTVAAPYCWALANISWRCFRSAYAWTWGNGSPDFAGDATVYQ